MEHAIVETITTNGTPAEIIFAIGGLALIGVLAYVAYIFYKHMDSYFTRTSAKADNEMYFHNVCTAYKVGVVVKTASEEGVELLYRPAEPEKNIADTLKDQVKAEISQ